LLYNDVSIYVHYFNRYKFNNKYTNFNRMHSLGNDLSDFHEKPYKKNERTRPCIDTVNIWPVSAIRGTAGVKKIYRFPNENFAYSQLLLIFATHLFGM